MKFFYLLLYFLILARNTSYAQIQYDSFEFEGRTRHYDVYLPQNFQPNMPVVLNLHGYGWGTKAHADYTLMHQYSDTTGYIVVYPEGSYAPNGVVGWNNGLRDHPFGLTDTTSNDVGFISALIDTLAADYNIDLSRVYCCGFSMGGEMTYRLSIELGHRFAAFASVAGKLNDISGNLGDPIHPFPILHIHGTNDIVEYYGDGPGNLWSVDSTLNYWIQNNSCQLPPDNVFLPDVNSSDGCTVLKISYSDCSDTSKVILYKVINGGHSWPGSADIGSPSWEGNKNLDINASVEILNFFNNYVISSVETITNLLPEEYFLFQNYPNPFNPTTTIKYQIPELSFVTLKVNDVLGNEIKTLLSEEKPVGSYEVEFNASELSSGIYFYRIQAGDFIETKKMILMK